MLDANVKALSPKSPDVADDFSRKARRLHRPVYEIVFFLRRAGPQQGWILMSPIKVVLKDQNP